MQGEISPPSLKGSICWQNRMKVRRREMSSSSLDGSMCWQDSVEMRGTPRILGCGVLRQVRKKENQVSIVSPERFREAFNYICRCICIFEIDKIARNSPCRRWHLTSQCNMGWYFAPGQGFLTLHWISLQ